VTDHPKIYGSYEAMLPWGELSLCLKALFIACHQRDRAAIYRLLQEIVPNYQPSPWLLTKGAEPNPASVEPAPVVPAGAASHRHKVAKPLSPAVQCIGI
jgi:hypothetical protein